MHTNIYTGPRLKVKTNKLIAERLNCCVMTDIGENIRIFEKIRQTGKISLIVRIYKPIFDA